MRIYAKTRPVSDLILKNPHSVLAALRTRPRDVVRVTIPSGPQAPRRGEEDSEDPWDQVARLARDQKVTVSGGSGVSSGGRRDAGRSGPREQNQRQDFGRTGSTEAVVKPRPGVSVEELFRGARDRQKGKGMWIALDSLQDPQNVGAIFRAASFFGVQGILLTTERSAPLSSAAYDVACGGLEDVPFTLQVNLQRGFEAAKEAGLWILGTSEHAEQTLSEVTPDRPWLLVLGNEEKGMRRLTADACDVTCRVPSRGSVTSLNVSVAAGILISRLSPTF